MSPLPGIGIIGCGLIGSKRALACRDAPSILVSDIAPGRAECLARELCARGIKGSAVTAEELFGSEQVSIAFVPVVFGCVMAAYVVQRILGLRPPVQGGLARP